MALRMPLLLAASGVRGPAAVASSHCNVNPVAYLVLHPLSFGRATAQDIDLFTDFSQSLQTQRRLQAGEAHKS